MKSLGAISLLSYVKIFCTIIFLQNTAIYANFSLKKVLKITIFYTKI